MSRLIQNIAARCETDENEGELFVSARANIIVNSVMQRIGSGGLGIDAASDDKYIDKIEKEQLAELGAILSQVGFSPTEIRAANEAACPIAELTLGERCKRGEDTVRVGAAVPDRDEATGGIAYPERPDDIIEALANIAHFCRREGVEFTAAARVAAKRVGVDSGEHQIDSYRVPGGFLRYNPGDGTSESPQCWQAEVADGPNVVVHRTDGDVWHVGIGTEDMPPSEHRKGGVPKLHVTVNDGPVFDPEKIETQ